MTIKDLIDFYGSRTRAAAELKVSENTIRVWEKKDRIPFLVQNAVQTLTKGKLKAD